METEKSVNKSDLKHGIFFYQNSLSQGISIIRMVSLKWSFIKAVSHQGVVCNVCWVGRRCVGVFEGRVVC